MNTSGITTLVQEHVEKFFQGHAIEYLTWQLGPINDVVPAFRVARITPGPKCNLWTYVSVGSAATVHPNASRLEFFLLVPGQTPRAVELLAMVAHRHTSDPLGKWHTLPIGEPWVDGATCDVFFISPPYTFGPDLEICDSGDVHIHILWLLPITQSEREFGKEHGVDALESAFEKTGIQYWRIDRTAVV